MAYCNYPLLNISLYFRFDTFQELALRNTSACNLDVFLVGNLIVTSNHPTTPSPMKPTQISWQLCNNISIPKNIADNMLFYQATVSKTFSNFINVFYW